MESTNHAMIDGRGEGCCDNLSGEVRGFGVFEEFILERLFIDFWTFEIRNNRNAKSVSYRFLFDHAVTKWTVPPQKTLSGHLDVVLERLTHCLPRP